MWTARLRRPAHMPTGPDYDIVSAESKSTRNDEGPARSCASGGARACKRERGPQGRAPPRAPFRGQALQAAWPSRSITVHATRRPGPRGLAAPGLLRTEAKRPSRRRKPVTQACDVRVRPGSSALGRPPSSTKTTVSASTDGPVDPGAKEKGPLNDLSSGQNTVRRSNASFGKAPGIAPVTIVTI